MHARPYSFTLRNWYYPIAPMDSATTLVLCTSAAFVASAINAVAGGGTFLTFPMLTGVAGLSEKAANITSTIGLWPGAASSVVAAREDYARIPRQQLVAYAIISIVGGTIGAILLRSTSPASFKFAIPWLLLAATLIFAFGKRLSSEAQKLIGHSGGMPIFAACIQFCIAIYGGYFGAGIGVLMLAGLAISGIDDLRTANALKAVLGTIINAVAVAIFLTSPDARWDLILPMAIASIAGGFLGMGIARKMPQTSLRVLVIVIGAILTVVYFVKMFK